jgi:hypothetical protein
MIYAATIGHMQVGNFLIGLETDIKTVVVTDEELSVYFGFPYDPVTYRATVLDAESEKLPASFIVNLQLDGVPVVVDQALTSGVYNQTTGLLTLTWFVPAGFGAATVNLQWTEQTI